MALPQPITRQRSGFMGSPASGREVAVQSSAEIIERVIIQGDLARLTPQERLSYYMEVCKSLGLNPMTRPLEYIVLDGRLTLYARKDCTDQLRKINGVSATIVGREFADDIYTVHVKATDKTGREDEDIGSVAMLYPAKMKRNGSWVDHPKAGQPLEGLDRANALMKGVTKAKRRVTLSISGAGFLDETEVEDISTATPAGKRKSAAASKRDGTNEVLEEIRRHIMGATDIEFLAQLADSYAQELADMPVRWSLIASQEFEDKWKDLGGDPEECPVVCPDEKG